MFAEIFYLLRSKVDGQYLVARPRAERADQKPDPGFLLMFKEYADALSYLNTHGSGVADRFAVESIPGSQLKALMNRWGFTGLGMVQDPLLPTVDFLRKDTF
jgi:hypothetical protein